MEFNPSRKNFKSDSNSGATPKAGFPLSGSPPPGGRLLSTVAGASATMQTDRLLVKDEKYSYDARSLLIDFATANSAKISAIIASYSLFVKASQDGSDISKLQDISNSLLPKIHEFKAAIARFETESVALHGHPLNEAEHDALAGLKHLFNNAMPLTDSWVSIFKQSPPAQEVFIPLMKKGLSHLSQLETKLEDVKTNPYRVNEFLYSLIE